MERPVIIALVGIDGAGKTTQARRLAQWLTSRGVRAAHFENPGGRPSLTRIARRVGRVDGPDLLGRGGNLAVEASVRWAAIARALTWSRLSGRVAVMDRYSYCQYAVMRVRGDHGERLARAWYAPFPQPDVVCFLAVTPERAQRRVLERGTDTEELTRLRALDAAYRSLPEADRFTVVDADGSPDEVGALLAEAVAARLGLVG